MAYPEISTRVYRSCEAVQFPALVNRWSAAGADHGDPQPGEVARQGRPRALIQMATGSGKTFTAFNFIYRLIKFGGARRVLFLVDRTNLGRQTLKEFQQYRTPDDNRKFTELYNVQHLQSNKLDDVRKVCITTIQRLYSMLQGREELDPELEEQSGFDSSTPLQREPVPGRLQPSHPDRDLRLHRHRRVPPLHLQPLAAGAGVLRRLPHRPHRHALEADLRLLQPEPGDGVQPRAGGGRRRQRRLRRLPHPHRRSPSRARPSNAGLLRGLSATAQTRKVRWEQLDEDFTYDADAARPRRRREDQIRTIVRTFQDKLFTEIFPGRTEVPKTLIFAKDDSHADDIVQIVREEFGKGNDFCQKITYRTGTARVVDEEGGRGRHGSRRGRPTSQYRRSSPRTCSPPSATATTRASPSPWT